jgi:hypothetical protein
MIPHLFITVEDKGIQINRKKEKDNERKKLQEDDKNVCIIF